MAKLKRKSPYSRTEDEIKALAHIIVGNNKFLVPHFEYQKKLKSIEKLMDNLEYICGILTRAADGKPVAYDESPEIVAWLHGQRSPFLDGYDRAIQKMVGRGGM